MAIYPRLKTSLLAFSTPRAIFRERGIVFPDHVITIGMKNHPPFYRRKRSQVSHAAMA
jgi:hypothetical protein